MVFVAFSWAWGNWHPATCIILVQWTSLFVGKLRCLWCLHFAFSTININIALCTCIWDDFEKDTDVFCVNLPHAQYGLSNVFFVSIGDNNGTCKPLKEHFWLQNILHLHKTHTNQIPVIIMFWNIKKQNVFSSVIWLILSYTILHYWCVISFYIYIIFVCV